MHRVFQLTDLPIFLFLFKINKTKTNSVFRILLLSGVPQRLVPDPIWFNIFVNDLLLSLRKTDFHNFAAVNTISATRITFKNTYREKAPSNKTPTLSKSMNLDFWVVVHQINSLYEVLKLKQIFWKNELVTGKTPFLVIGPFCTPHSICLNIGSG